MKNFMNTFANKYTFNKSKIDVAHFVHPKKTVLWISTLELK